MPGPNGYTIFTADYVDTVEGTGLVHQAPYGEDDMNTLNAYASRAPTCSTMAAASPRSAPTTRVISCSTPTCRSCATCAPAMARSPRFRKSAARPLPGEKLRALLPALLALRHPADLQAGLLLVRVRDQDQSPRLLELNQLNQLDPLATSRDGQFGKWLANARDWSISCNRFWGSPIPVWVSDDPKYPRVDVYGSLEELKADFGDPARQVTVTSTCTVRGSTTYPRQPGRPDWQVAHAPYFRCARLLVRVRFHVVRAVPTTRSRTREKFEQHFPADYIVEYIGQTRGWFYLLHVMATALFDRPAFLRT